MSLGYIYLCCDDGECYTTEFVEGDGWCISLEEFDDDELWVPAGPRPKGQSRNVPRPAVDPVELATRLGIPIQSLRPRGVRSDWKKRQWQTYAIDWKRGVAFPRRLLPQNFKPKLKKNLGEGTYCCMTSQHRPVRWATIEEAGA